MAADHLLDIDKFGADLWKIADDLRANSGRASNEYFMPIMGLIFLRHATNRYYKALESIEADKAASRMPNRGLIEADFTRRRALMLPEAARYDVLLKGPKDGNLGSALTAAMEAVEAAFPPLAGQLPRDYQRFEGDLLERMLRMFDSEALRTASGDVFGRIYEYFLAEFSKQGAHDNGEFFTPPSIVQTIVNVIEPDHGIVFDPACGSGGMFVQSSHFIEDEGLDTMKRVTFYGHEKNETTAKLAQINLAVHGLQGTIRAGNEAITYCKDPHELVSKCDFVMANPPFNVDEVDAEKVKGDRLRKMNPLSIELYKRYKYDITLDPLEFAINNQHMNGGLAVNTWGQTNLAGCYAVGEAAGTHGVTRPGGAALNAGQVFGTRCAEHIAASRKPHEATKSEERVVEEALAGVLDALRTDSALNATAICKEIQDWMSDHAGILCKVLVRSVGVAHIRQQISPR